MKLFKKTFLFLFFLSLLFVVTACNKKDSPVEDDNKTSEVEVNDLEQRKIYELAKKSGYTGTYEEWLDSIRGEDGDKVELRVHDGKIEWKYSKESDWKVLASVDDLFAEYTVKFVTGTSAKVPDQKVKENGKVKKPQDPVKAGYDFVGWFVDDEKWMFSGFTVTENLTLTARFVKKAIYEYVKVDGGIKLTRYLEDKEDVIVPDTIDDLPVVELGSGLFKNNQNLKSLHIGVNVEKIPADAIYNCRNLAKIVVDDENPVYNSTDNCNAIIRTADNVLVDGSLGTVLPDTVKEIGEGAFAKFADLEIMPIGRNVTKIGANAFEGCTKLQEVYLQDSLTSVGVNAFKGVKEVYLQSSVYDTQDNITDGKVVVDVCSFSQMKNVVPENWHEADGDAIEDVPGVKTASKIKDGVILHAWNWSYKTIEQELDNIKNAGFTTIQVSPVQQPKDYRFEGQVYDDWRGQWWKLYQPLSFSVAKESWLGTKEDLTSMCKKAEEKGLFVIADIVVNHLANDGAGDEGPGKAIVHHDVAIYEPEVYAGREQYFREYIPMTDGSAEKTVHGCLGMPDLRTELPFIQKQVTDLLKECIDCGVDGFRFDAAKHIETPDDVEELRSDFWPNVIGGAKDYMNAKHPGQELYNYGEILYHPGEGRSFDFYTKHINVTDNGTGNSIREAVLKHDAAAAAKSTFDTGCAPSNVVLWAESHDTYANNDETTFIPESEINKTWALVAARKEATALYFARPEKMSIVGDRSFMNREVQKVNYFHNEFNSAESKEYISHDSSVVMVERQTGSLTGAVLVNVNGQNKDVRMPVHHLKDGWYRDSISNNGFYVSNGVLEGTIGETGIAVLSSSYDTTGLMKVNKTNGVFSDHLILNITTSTPDYKVVVKVNGKVVSNGKANMQIMIGDNARNGETIKVEICASSSTKHSKRTYYYTKLQGVSSNTVIISDIPDKYLNGSEGVCYAWTWNPDGTGRWVKLEKQGKFMTFKHLTTEIGCVIAIMPLNYVPNGDDAFDYVIGKSNDISYSPYEIHSFLN